jgi:hypothetical protein
MHLDRSKIYVFAFALLLALAASLHYFAVLVWFSFVLAEGAVLYFDRRLRIWAWIAILAGTAPLWFFGGLLMELRRYYGAHFWAKPSLTQVFVHNYLFGLNAYWGTTLAVIVTICLLVFCWIAWKESLKDSKRSWVTELVLIMALLWLPVFAIVLAKISRGVMFDRYLLPAILGAAIGIGYLSNIFSGRLKLVLAYAMLFNFALSSTGKIMKMVPGLVSSPRMETVLGPRKQVANKAHAILAQAKKAGLPVVISAGLEYLPLSYYQPADAPGELYCISDAAAANVYGGSDSMDLVFKAMQKYFPLHVVDYASFTSEHKEFLLFTRSISDSLDWWPKRLSREGHKLEIVSYVGGALIYKVTLQGQR